MASYRYVPVHVPVPMFKDITKQSLFHKSVLFKVRIKNMAQVIIIVFWIKHCVVGINEYKLSNFFIQKSLRLFEVLLGLQQIDVYINDATINTCGNYPG